MNIQVSTAATLTADELARATEVFGDVSPPGTQLLGKGMVGVRRRRAPRREVVYALDDPHHPPFVEPVTSLGAIQRSTDKQPPGKRCVSVAAGRVGERPRAVPVEAG